MHQKINFTKSPKLREAEIELQTLAVSAKSGCEESKKRVFEKLLPVAERIARTYCDKYNWVDAEDLAQEMLLVVPGIIRRYDPSNSAGNSFSKYAYHRLYFEAKDCLRQEDPLGIKWPQKKHYPEWHRLGDEGFETFEVMANDADSQISETEVLSDLAAGRAALAEFKSRCFGSIRIRPKSTRRRLRRPCTIKFFLKGKASMPEMSQSSPLFASSEQFEEPSSFGDIAEPAAVVEQPAAKQPETAATEEKGGKHFTKLTPEERSELCRKGWEKRKANAATRAARDKRSAKKAAKAKRVTTLPPAPIASSGLNPQAALAAKSLLLAVGGDKVQAAAVLEFVAVLL